MTHLNVEIKAKYEDLAKAEDILMKEGAVLKGTDHQTDTYFDASNFRLKLREGNIENALISYDRNDLKGPKDSVVDLYKPADIAQLKVILKKTVGVKVVVEKERKIFFIENVKFHLDEVKDLGNFVEIEAIDKEGSLNKEKLTEQCKRYKTLLDIKEEDLIARSYSDLLIEKIDNEARG
ncbi:class IV adenylate cyclase [Rapidithrix thailandica]|uniref:Class IV adenylate cyclase n=1 Tax=Rapidithrix thailandica TaxID=413964 RepID=A0AAW9S2C0_9BACT